MKWYWVTSPYKIKSHFISETLLEVIVEDLKSRVHDLNLNIKDCSYGYFDLPGIMLINTALFEMDIDGLKLNIPSWQGEDILSIIKESKVRFGGKEETEYYKLHGYCRCLVLTTEQRDRFISQLEYNLQTNVVTDDVK